MKNNAEKNNKESIGFPEETRGFRVEAGQRVFGSDGQAQPVGAGTWYMFRPWKAGTFTKPTAAMS